MTFRPASLSYFAQTESRLSAVRGQNFAVFRARYAPQASSSLSSDDEILLIFHEVGGEVGTSGGWHPVPPRSIAIASAGTIEIRLSGPGQAYALTTGAAAQAQQPAVNADDYRTPDPRVKPVPSRTPAALGSPPLRVYSIDRISAPAAKSRLKFLQTATMSINWVEYDGPRDRAQLSPHAHADFEQGSLAIQGDFVHHIRTPWIPDANQWRDDQHLAASQDSLLVIPPELVHTTEGVGGGKHVLVDIFAPPREDFIAKGWVHNAHDYATAQPTA